MVVKCDILWTHNIEELRWLSEASLVGWLKYLTCQNHEALADLFCSVGVLAHVPLMEWWGLKEHTIALFHMAHFMWICGLVYLQWTICWSAGHRGKKLHYVTKVWTQSPSLAQALHSSISVCLFVCFSNKYTV